MTDDEKPWLIIAMRVIRGEFRGCCRSARESMTIGLRNINHSVCRRALERLATEEPTRP